MSKMFYHMIKLESINVSSFQTDNVIDMSCIFAHDCSLTKLDLKSFKIDKVKNMTNMFYSSYNLKKKIYLILKFQMKIKQMIMPFYLKCLMIFQLLVK